MDSSWHREDLPVELPGPRPPVARWDFSIGAAGSIPEGWLPIRSIQNLVPGAPDAPDAAVGILEQNGTRSLQFAAGGFGALVLAQPVSPRTRYLLRARVRGDAGPQDVFRGIVVCSLREPMNREALDAGRVAALWAEPSARTFQDQFLREEVDPDEASGWTTWQFVLPPTMFGTRSFLLSLVSGFTLKEGARAPAFSVASLELHEVPARDSLGCPSWPPVELPDADAIDPDARCALVRRDQDSRPSLLLTRGSRAVCGFEHPDGASRLELSLTLVPEARLNANGATARARVTIELQSEQGTVRHDLVLELEEDRPWFWTDWSCPLAAEGSRCELRVTVEGEDSVDGPLIALSVPRVVPSTRRTPALNLLVISLDTLRADRVGKVVDGHSLTPNLDALAARATVFNAAFSTSSYTLPAHVSMFTGQHVSRHRMLDPRRRLPPSSVTMTEVLAEAGYRTAAFTAGAMLNPEFCGLHRGFDEYTEIDPMVSRIDPLPEKVPRWYAPEYNAAVFEAHRLDRRVLPWLRDRTAPFFCFIHTYLVHDYHPDRDLHGMLVRPQISSDRLPKGAGPSLWERDEGVTGVTGTSLTRIDPENPGDWVQERDLPYLESLYDATVFQGDRALGRILTTLQEAGLADQTIVVVTSDHGEEFLEHGGLAHARTLYEEVLRIPFVIAVPGQIARTVDEPVDLADLAPTLLSLLGTPELPDPTGECVLDGSNDLQTMHHGVVLHAGASAKTEARLLRATREQQYKVIQTLDGVGELGRSLGEAERQRLHDIGYVLPEGIPEEERARVVSEEAFDLVTDPAEQVGLGTPYATQAEILERLRQRLQGPREND